MGVAQALALERFLEGEVLAKKPGATLLIGSGAKLLRACDLPTSSSAPSSLLRTLPALDAVFAGGLPDRRLIELVGRRSAGRFSLALAALACATARGDDAALVDLGDHFDPQVAEAAGVDLARLLWARPRRVKDALAAAEILVATGFRLVVAEMGLTPRGGRFVPDAAWVRLQRTAQTQGSTLLLFSPYRMSGIAADAVVSAGSTRPIWRGSGRAPRLLAGISSRVTLEKYGRETPNRSASMDLSVAEARCGRPQGPPLRTGKSNNARHRFVGAGVCGGRTRRMSRPSVAVAADDARFAPARPLDCRLSTVDC
jgi:recA bacterial DNA recombination protein